MRGRNGEWNSKENHAANDGAEQEGQGYAQSEKWAQIIIDFESLSLQYGIETSEILQFISEQATKSPKAFFNAVRGRTEYNSDLATYCRNPGLSTFWNNFNGVPSDNTQDQQRTFDSILQYY